MSSVVETVAQNLSQVRLRMQRACERVGRPVDSVRLVAVTKYVPLEAIAALISLGHATLGENRPQQLLERSQALPPAEWHLIGHLQRNKVRAVLPAVSLIHSVDSLRLLERISEVAGEIGITTRVLLEVNVSGEQAKDGFSPHELQSHWKQAATLPNIDIQGLMTMAPLTDDPEQARPHFRNLKNLRDVLLQTSPGCSLPELSMGMSGDFEVAIEEGATLVRVGSLLFEGLDSLPH